MSALEQAEARLSEGRAVADRAVLNHNAKLFIEAPRWKRLVLLDRVLGSAFTDPSTLQVVSVEDATDDQLIRALEGRAAQERNRRNHWTYRGNRLVALTAYAEALRELAAAEEAA